MTEKQNTTDYESHPWYGPCDALAWNSGCSECLVEKVGRAICRSAIGGSPRFEEIYDDQRYLYRTAANAAIGVMLETMRG
jgi:hypothetical protein